MAPRVALRMDSAQALVAYVGINCRGVKPAMAKKILDYPQVSTVVEHVRGACMPQQMASSAVGHSDGVEIAPDQMTYRAKTEPVTVSC